MYLAVLFSNDSQVNISQRSEVIMRELMIFAQLGAKLF